MNLNGGIIMTVNDIEEQINYLRKCKNALQEPIILDERYFDENILKIYIGSEKLSSVVEYIKDKGYRKNGGVQYSSNDISNIIDKSDNGILSEMAKKILKKNRSSVNRRYN